jgi:hypothetical protein
VNLSADADAIDTATLMYEEYPMSTAKQIQAASPAPAPAEQGALVSMIERAARDPAVDMDKLERLVLMQERMLLSAAELRFNEAMALAQAEMGRIATDASNTQTKSRYATYAAIDRVIRPIYTKHGFALSFDTEDGAPQDHVRIICFVSNGGFTRKYKADMPADGKGAKGGDVMTKTHAMGAGMQYGQRYLVKLIFNLAIGTDDDGNAAGNKPVTADEAAELAKIVQATGADINKVLTAFQIESLSDLPASKFEECKNRLQRAARNR